MYYMPYLFFTNFKNQDLLTKSFQIAAISIFCYDYWWYFCFGCDSQRMVHLICLFMKTHLLALLQNNCLDLVRCAFLCKCLDAWGIQQCFVNTYNWPFWPISLVSILPHKANSSWSYFAFSQTWLVEVVTRQVWNAWLAQLIVMPVTVQSDGQVLAWFQCWQTVSSFLFELCKL